VYLSHYDKDTGYKKKLSDHLTEVYENTEVILKETPVMSGYENAVKRICKIAAITHDFGKYTSFFQDYLEIGENNQLKQHSFISALFGSFILYKDQEKPQATLPYAELILYLAILHHHGNLRVVSEDVVPKRVILRGDPHPLFTRMEILEEQIKNIKNQLFDINQDLQPVLSLLKLKEKNIVGEFLDSWIDIMDEVYKQYYQLKRKESKKESRPIIEDTYYYMLLIYSILLNADKYSAANITPPPRLHIPASLVDDYREKKFDITTKEGTNGWRNKMYDTVMKKIDENREQLDKQHLYTLTAPTGAGKTLLSLSVACKWRNWIKESKGYIPSIIYALPFTSIIDQNELQIQKLLMQLHDFKENRHRYLVKHHHLTTIEYIKENEELPINQSLLLIENWEAEIIVTTYIQLFYTLIGHENRALKKFHQIAGSIVILDEIQNIPVEYWRLLRKVLSKMAELFSCKFILLTATQPLIFEKGETIELLEDNEIKNVEFFKEMERVSLSLFVDESRCHYEVEEWVDMFLKNFEEGKSYLAIFNTIHTSLLVFKNLRSILENFGYSVFYLSTNIIPNERKCRIEKIRLSLEKKQNVMVISTQVVEAGVDFDFDIVYRDLGPVDAIVQAAGRCNRHGFLNKYGQLGEIRVTPVARNGQLESVMVYKGIHTNVAKNILPAESVQESGFFDLIEKYYNTIKTLKKTDHSYEILDAMNHLRFSKKDKTEESLVSDFCLIPDNPLMIDTFVEIDKKAEKIWKRFLREVINERDFKKRFEANIKLKADLRKYIISAPIRIVKNLADEETSKTRMIRIPKDILDQYYNNDFGLIRSLQDGEVWML
jgi:CRISPR-associated endonuclease/helicase Cas3